MMIRILVLVGLVLGLASERLMACASCGSGSGSPLVLYPNEKVKTYFGLSQQAQIRAVGADSQIFHSTQAEQKSTYTVGFGFRLYPTLALVFNQPYTKNTAAGQSKTGSGDPSFEGRWLIVPGAWDRPLLPQMQVIFGHKFSLARSINETEDMRQLDVFGNGFDESTLGIDSWWGMMFLKPGFALMLSKPWARDYSGIRIQRGLRTQIVYGLGHTFWEVLHLNSGIRNDFKTKDRSDGDLVADSDSLQYDFFTSLRWSNSIQEIKVTGTLSSFGKQNKNAVRSKNFSIGFGQIL